MKTRGAALVVTLLVFVFPIAGFAKDCSEGRSSQHQIGPETLLSQLRDSAKKGSSYALFFEQGEFETETFAYIGKVTSTTGKNFHIAFLETIWGASCRRTSRLMVFSEDKKYLGHYYGLPVSQFHIKKNDLVLWQENNPEQKFQLAFTESTPPNRILVAGDLYDFEK